MVEGLKMAEILMYSKAFETPAAVLYHNNEHSFNSIQISWATQSSVHTRPVSRMCWNLRKKNRGIDFYTLPYFYVTNWYILPCAATGDVISADCQTITGRTCIINVEASFGRRTIEKDKWINPNPTKMDVKHRHHRKEHWYTLPVARNTTTLLLYGVFLHTIMARAWLSQEQCTQRGAL